MKIFFFNYLLPISTVFTLLLNVNCQRDDICDTFEVTPRLIINFIDDDINNSDNLTKSVTSLAVRLIVDKDDILNPENRYVTTSLVDSSLTTSSLILPFNTLKDTITYVFTRNFNSENEALIEEDTIVLSYKRTNNFINRACGFQTTFDDLKINRKTNVWISNDEILNTTITDEQNPHLLLFH